MPLPICSQAVSQSIYNDCSAPITGGYTGRGFLIQMSDKPVFTKDSSNPRIVSAITLPSSAKTIAIENVKPEAFSGSTTQSNADNGYIKYLKTVQFDVPQRGAAVSKNLIDAMVNSPNGFVLCAEKRDTSGDGSFEMIGVMSPLRVNADGVSRDDNANDGATQVIMSCSEYAFEVTLFDTDYATTLTEFETLYNNCYQ